jgi:4'-phosphopantetheinyl transferase EntD
VISQILPPQAASAEAFADVPGARLFASEEAVMGGASLERYAEFSTGRACARTALARLGLPPVAILPGPRGEPRWPGGVTGSITHCAGYRAGAVARSTEVPALGIDAEPDSPLPAGVLATVAAPAELAWLGSRMREVPQVRWDTLLFSAKEAAYKAWFPLTGATPGFADVAMTDPVDGRFTLHLLTPGPWPRVLEGGWLAGHGLIITAVAAPAWPTPAWPAPA